jgi:hypothetical protein
VFNLKNKEKMFWNVEEKTMGRPQPGKNVEKAFYGHDLRMFVIS